MGLLAVFSTLLMRYSAQQDFLICIPIANRNRKQIEELIGFFVNTIVAEPKAQTTHNPNVGEGRSADTLLEQTGRMNLGIDSQTDFLPEFTILLPLHG